MRESRTYGSGRGARGNSRPYRETNATHERLLLRRMSQLVAVPQHAGGWHDNTRAALARGVGLFAVVAAHAGSHRVNPTS
jgi:hypothetical protein